MLKHFYAALIALIIERFWEKSSYPNQITNPRPLQNSNGRPLKRK